MRRWFVGLMCLPLLAVAGCSDDEAKGDSDPTPTVSGSSSPTESETPDEPVEPERPTAMDGSGAAAAKAFVKYYWDVVSYAQVTGDTQTLRGLSVETCAPCDAGVKSIEDVYKAHGHITGGRFTVEKQKLFRVRGGTNPVFQIDVEVSVTRQVVVPRKGAKRTSNKGGTASMRLTVSRDRTHDWRISQWEAH